MYYEALRFFPQTKAFYIVAVFYIKNNASSNHQLALKLLQILCVYKVQNVIILPENWQMIDECETILDSNNFQNF